MIRRVRRCQLFRNPESQRSMSRSLLHDGEQAAGSHSASFALRDAAERKLASGLYLLQLEAEGRVLTRRLAKIR